MPRCSWRITKGTKKGSTCNIYSKKKYDGKCYCAAHYNKLMSIENESSGEKEIKKSATGPKKEVKKSSSKSSKPKVEIKKSKPIKIQKSEEQEDIELMESSENENWREEELDKPTLDTHSLDDLIEYEYQDALKKELKKNDLDILKEKVDYLLKRMNELFPPVERKRRIQEDNYDEIPELEVFKK